MLVVGCLQDDDDEDGDNQPAFVNLFARLAQAKGNYGGGPAQASHRQTAPNQPRNPRPKSGAGPQKRRSGAVNGKGTEEDEADSDDLPLDQVVPQNKKPRQGQGPVDDGPKEGKPGQPTARAKQHQFNVVDDDDELSEEDKQTVDRFARLISEFKDLQAPNTGEDGAFSQWIKDCSGHELVLV